MADLLSRHPSVSGRVLELGSLDVNGSIRPLFDDRERFTEYIGMDMRDGPGVDVLGRGDALPFDDGYFGAVISVEMLEHDSRFWMTLAECRRVLVPGGWLLITTRAFEFPRHDHPQDYWRFSADGLREAIQWAGFEFADAVEDRDDGAVYGIARRLDGVPATIPTRVIEPRLLVEAEVELLRERTRALIPLGVTAVADAFERVDSDRRLLLGIVQRVWRESNGVSSFSQGLWEQIMEVLATEQGTGNAR